MFEEVTVDQFSISRLTDRPRNLENGKNEPANLYQSAETRFGRRSSVDKGKQMIEIKKKSHEINARLQSLENRIKFIEGEQVKAQKSVLIAKERFKKYNKIRQSAEDDKQLNSTVKDLRFKDLMDTKKKVACFKESQKNSIFVQKEKILKKNLIIKSEVKKKILKDEAEIQRSKNNYIFEQQRRNRAALGEYRNMKENSRIRNSSLKSMREEQYIQKMQSEIELQNHALERIKTLERLEKLLIESGKVDDLALDIDNDLLSLDSFRMNSSGIINIKNL